MSLFDELKRRNVFRVGAAYVVAGWLIIQVVETIFPAFGFGDAAIRIVTIVLAIGLIPVLIFAWAFELTPEGLKKESDVDRTESGTPHTGKKLDRLIMVVLAVALGYFAVDKFVLDPQRDAAKDEQVAVKVEEAKQQGRTEALVESYGEKSIAVLAFDDMSQAGDQEYLSDGIAEELLNLLAKIPELRVISRSSAFSFKGQNLELTEVANRLNVAHILEGSVRKSGNRVRITAQLIEARSDTQMWSETYDRTLDDVFAIQDDIAATVVDQLKITLLGETPHIQEADPEAYALYLQARHLGHMATAEAWEQSNALYQQALDIDPEYAAAWNGLSKNYRRQVGNGLLPRQEGNRMALVATNKALAIDPDFAQAYAELGWAAVQNDLAQAARHLTRALQLDPTDSNTINNAAVLLRALGRHDEAIVTQAYVTARDPVDPLGHFNLGLIYLDAGHWEESIASFQTTLRLSPEFIGAYYFMGHAYLYQGAAESALETYALENDEEYRVKGQALALYTLGRTEEYQSRLSELIERWGDQWPSEVAHVYAWTGNADATFEWLDKAIIKNEAGLSEQFLLHVYSPIRHDPRWTQFLKRAGSSPAQLAAIKFEVKLPGQ